MAFFATKRKDAENLYGLCVRILCERCVEKRVRDVLTQRTQRERKDRKGFVNVVSFASHTI